MVGSALARHFRELGHEVSGKSSRDLDFTNRIATIQELKKERPDSLIIAAAKVGGIGANSAFPVDFLSKNLQIQTNLMDAAHLADVERLLFLGSSCIYPKFAPQPIQEESLLTGLLEPTNEPYAIAKIAGIKLINAYRKQYGRRWISAMPTNLYGPGDNFDFETSHVLPALIAKFHHAKSREMNSVTLWGNGTPLREFLHVHDLAKACEILMKEYDDESPINIGSGQEISIHELAKIIAKTVGYVGKIQFDQSKPNGTPRKALQNNRISRLGWKPEINLPDGIRTTYEWYLNSLNDKEMR